MKLPKLSLALSTLLLTAANASTMTTEETTQEWYVASQAKSFFRHLVQNNEQNHRQLFTSTDVADAVGEAADQNEHDEQAQRQLTNTNNVYSKMNSSHQSGTFAQLRKHQPLSADDIINSLNQYDKIWIEVKPEKTSDDSRRPSTSGSHSSSPSGPCVWSECGFDVDEDYTGDNRDGDSQWYQFRTQSFCANAGFALYGRKKGEVWGKWGDCTGRHFINSFFTYGGADTLLKAVGVTPEVYYGGNYVKSNAKCVYTKRNGAASYSTLGCAADGNFMIGFFNGKSCDGNYYVGGSDDFSRYNDVFKAVKCHEMSVVDDMNALYTLLSNSWACDVRTYGTRCPDPFKLKGYYEYALQTAAAGGNPIRAYNNLAWKDQLRLFSWVLMGISIALLFAAFSIKQCVIKKPLDGFPSSNEEEGVSPTASHMTVGKTRIELEDGGKLKNTMETVSTKTLSAAAWLQSKFGRGKDPERTFQSSSPEKKNSSDDDASTGYKSPDAKLSSRVELTRSLTPSTARRELNTCGTDDDISLEMAPRSSSTSPLGRVAEHDDNKHWVTVKTPRQSLQ
jgi:Spy/CpxP family protein refolding chaperone